MNPIELLQNPEMQIIGSLAREIALDINDLPTILKNHGLDIRAFEKYKRNPAFQNLLSAELATWNSSLNTPERVKLRAGTMIESWLPELFASMHDKSTPLAARIEAGKLAARLAGMGERDVREMGGGGGVKVVINMGNQTARIEKVIEHQPSSEDR